MINMDMIGRVRNQSLSVLGVGTSPEFQSWIQEFDKTVGLQITFSSGGHDGSDHISFNAKHIPIMFFFSGLHSEYHRPSDTSDKINSQGGHSGADSGCKVHRAPGQFADAAALYRSA
jgi:Zn-dependent M28 family amino/carboxypeptidase